MAVGGVGGLSFQNFQPYIVNTNRLDRSSLNRIEALPEDGLENAGVDFSKVAGQEQENTNPLKPGETSDFQGVLDAQMASGRQNAARIFGDQAPEAVQAAVVQPPEQSGADIQEQLDQQAEQNRQLEAMDPTVQGASAA